MPAPFLDGVPVQRAPEGAGYAVVDVETTGLTNRDRIVEVAVVHTDERGEVTGHWHTLVNPRRDLGRQDLHGVRAADARRAPLFAEIAGEVAAQMSGRIPVAHNINFDHRLLSGEFARLGIAIPHLPAMGVCTMTWAPHYLPGRGRSLAACREFFGIVADRPHEALSDALDTAAVLRAYLAQGEPPWHALPAAWPELPRPETPVRLRNTVAETVVEVSLRPGDTVVLTGSFPEGKDHWSDLARAAGLQVAGHVSKGTAAVLAADPDTMSGKAEAARRHGVPVTGVEALLGLQDAAAQPVLQGPPQRPARGGDGLGGLLELL